MIEPIDNSNVDWKVGDKVDSIGGIFKGGTVVAIEKEPLGKIFRTTLSVLWPNGITQKRADTIVRKVN